MSPVRVLIADDDEIFRDALADFIRDEESMELVGEAADATGAVALARELEPDVAVVDVKMPGGGRQACEGIIAQSPRTRVLVLSAYDDEATVRQLRQAGACGHLVKGTSSTDLTASILAAAPDGTQGR